MGIEPLFPPQEDFHVCDVLAVISAYDDNGKLRGAAPDLPLLRKSVRLTHIDLRAISGRNPDTPVFAETKLDANSKVVLHQERTEVQQEATSRLPLDLVSFPSLTIVNDDGVGAGDDSWVSFAGQRTLQTEERVTINSAVTYGARGPDAIAMLSNWCDQSQNAPYCTDALPRRILNFTTDPDVLKTRDDKYVYRIEIKLITRVYMTREIDFSRSANGSVGAVVGQTEIEEPKKKAAGSVQPSALAPGEAVATEALPVKTTALQVGKRAEMSLGMGKIVFARPVVFGFNAVTFALEPSRPAPARRPASSSPRGKPIR